ncbi:hypothetical protein BCR34DRAFT_585794 [Clohesyomyces aquaticus]|uniref:Uncharacterized protein n=1 Tax=Clohesyomyces aquaticus TaxID=1231657 RepID=A0A1Y1ZWF9_9PLEO|nr:hypothetical protein BCR34DRAFT_585794 [Clohesyomyces aquaticus]
MRLSFPQASIMYALVANGVSSAASSVSLANFTPRIENLPAVCQAAYTRPIAGCTAGDFSGNNAKCSSACVQGLVDIQKLVTTNCGDVDVPETSIIGVFLLGTGIPILCPGVEVTTIAPSASKTEQVKTSAPAPATSTEEVASSTVSTAVSSSTFQTSVVSTSAAAAPTFATLQPPPASSRSSSTSSAKSTATAASQKSNSESGGGSPFDVVSTGAAASFSDQLSATVVVGIIVLLFAVL